MNKIIICMLVLIAIIVSCTSVDTTTNNNTDNNVTEEVKFNSHALAEYKEIKDFQEVAFAGTKLSVITHENDSYNFESITTDGYASGFFYREEDNKLIIVINLDKGETFPFVAYYLDLSENIDDLMLDFFIDEENHVWSTEKEHLDCKWTELDRWGYNNLDCKFTLKTVFEDGEIWTHQGEFLVLFFIP